MIKNLRPALRAWSQFHEDERLVAWVKNQRAVVWLTPRRRRIILSGGALLAGLAEIFETYLAWRHDAPEKTWLVPSLAFPVLLGMLYLFYLAAAHFQKLPAPVRQRPQLTIHLLFWAALAVLWLTPDTDSLWRQLLALIAISTPYLIWRIGYMLMSGQRGKARRTAFRDHLFYLWPVWGGPNTPIGKGWDYLSRCEAATPESYARSMLAGLRLMFVVLFLELVKLFLAAILYAPRRNIIARLLGGRHLRAVELKDIVTGKAGASLFMKWTSLYLELIWDVLRMAARSHKWVAALRAVGFNVFRNTYKPLLAESIVDFWNRYYYYFKELLVEFFFYPVYLRWFRAHPRLRMLAAVFAAAFAGNMYYHFIQGSEHLAAGELMALAERLAPRTIYCFGLALGIYFSMLRQQERRGQAQPEDSAAERLNRLRRIAGVWTFYSLINYWNLKTELSIFERIRFFLSLFGV